jgi:hypothetical protein
MIFRRITAKFRSFALDEAPMEVIRMKVFVCVFERDREREGGANKQLMAYNLGARERERGWGRKQTLEWHRGLRGG